LDEGGRHHIRNEDAEATKQQDGARRQVTIRHQGCEDARQEDDREEHQRE
jgi:hypothetical protein